MTTPNLTWWIVLTPNSIGELTGVLIDAAGERVTVLNGSDERPLVEALAGYAEPTVDVSVAHGWDQAPADLAEAYRASSRRRT